MTLFGLGILVLICSGIIAGLQWAAWRRQRGVDLQPLTTQLELLRAAGERLERGLQDQASTQRQEIGTSITRLGETFSGHHKELAALQRGELQQFAQRLAELTTALEGRFDQIRTAVEGRLQYLQEDNARQLEAMRKTVDEQLQGTLERRLGESFKFVSERLEQVHRGLGEMQTLAAGVGDLQRVLTNVKTRGTWGEIQLGMLLDQVLTPEQYAANVITKEGTNERVDFVITLPGRGADQRQIVWLPIDAKFPIEAYQRLLDAVDRADAAASDEAGRELERQIKLEAKRIGSKYLQPPRTTDFAVMYLPAEGLYAEVLRRPGLAESLQRDWRVIACGPMNLYGLLNSLQIGFRTMAIEQRSAEVWRILNAVKAEFGKFGDLLEKVKKKLDEAANTIDDAGKRSRAIERRLDKVQALPSAAEVDVLPVRPLDPLPDRPELDA